MARDDALRQVLNLGHASELTANRFFHKLLINGVPVNYQHQGETRGDFVRLIDWANGWRKRLVGGQSVQHSRPQAHSPPDIILFHKRFTAGVDGTENPADINADIWKPLTKFKPTANKFRTYFNTTK